MTPAERTWQQVTDATKKADVPEGLWERCPSCEAMVFNDLEFVDPVA